MTLRTAVQRRRTRPRYVEMAILQDTMAVIRAAFCHDGGCFFTVDVPRMKVLTVFDAFFFFGLL